MNANTSSRIQAAIQIINDGFHIPSLGAGKRALIYIAPIDAVSPLTVPEARRLVFAKSLTELLTACEYEVYCHSLFADDHEALNRLTVSIWLRYLELCGEEGPYPEGCYQGDYIFDFAATVHRTHGNRWQVAAGEVAEAQSQDQTAMDSLIKSMRIWLGEAAVTTITQIGRQSIAGDITNDLREISIGFDGWSSASELVSEAIVADCLQRLDAHGAVLREGNNAYLNLAGMPNELLQTQNGPTPFATQLSDYLMVLDRDGKDSDLNIFINDNESEIPLSLLQQCAHALGYANLSWVKKAISQPQLLEMGELVSHSPLAEDFVSLRETRQTIGWQNLQWFLLSHQSSETMSIDLSGVADLQMQKCNGMLQETASLARSELSVSAVEVALKALNPSQRQSAELFFEIVADYPTMVDQARQTLEPALLIHYYRKLCETVFSYYNNRQIKISDIQQDESNPIRPISIVMATALQRLAEMVYSLNGLSTHSNQ
jgi:arginyl-tRNA synthetase